MYQAARSPICRLPHARRAARRSRHSFAVNDRWVDDALRHRADGYRLLDSPLVGLLGVQPLARRRSRRSAFADAHATRALLQKATEQASAILSPQQALALQLFCDGLPMAAIAGRLGLRSRQHVWVAYRRRPAVEALTREYLTLAPAESPTNSS